MLKQLLSCLFTVALCLSARPQLNTPDEMSAPPLLLENVHLHLNKTTFAPGEHLWFTAYVQDQQQRIPSVSTANLHVGVFDSQGRPHKKKMLLVENGAATGDFVIDSTWADTEYKVVAWTNYMRNFKKLKPFEQRIRLIRELPGQEQVKRGPVRLECYPEGGHLIEGAFNQIGIRAVDGQVNGVEIKDLELVDADNRVVIAGIGTNEFGLGRFGFLASFDMEYRLRSSDKKVNATETVLPEAGSPIGLSIDNTGDKVVFTLLGDKEFLRSEEWNSYGVAIYQDTDLFWQEIALDPSNPAFSIDRTLLPIGVQTAVLVDFQNQPIAYRMFYNHRKDKSRRKDLAFDYCLTAFRDSLQLDFALPDSDMEAVDISVSVLPGETVAYHPKNSLYAAFELLPYVEKTFLNRYDHYDDLNRKKRFELDTRLLIEGWGRYDWDARRWENIRLEYATEQGVPITGKIIDADLNVEQQAYLTADLTREATYVELGKDKSFRTAMNLFESDSVGITILGNKGKLRKPNVDTFIGSTQKAFQIEPWTMNSKTSGDFVDDTNELPEITSLSKRTIALEEVVVTERAKPNPKFQLTAQIEGSTINDDVLKRNKTVVQYLRRLGFRVYMGGSGIIVESPRYPNPNATIFVNGMVASPGEILNMPLARVKSIVYSYKLLGYAAGGMSFVSIVLNPEHYVAPKNRKRFAKFLVENGYSKPQRYFDPGYADYGSDVFTRYGAVFWKGQTSVQSEFPTSITVPIKEARSLFLAVEGMGVDGSLISTVKRIPTNLE